MTSKQATIILRSKVTESRHGDVIPKFLPFKRKYVSVGGVGGTKTTIAIKGITLFSRAPALRKAHDPLYGGLQGGD
jgi:hypothetical protein